MAKRSSIELFTGAGGLAIGLEKAGWHHDLLVEYNHHACDTLRANKSLAHRYASDWKVRQADVREVDFSDFEDKVDLVAGGPPCQPFSLGGKHRGHRDHRDMFPEAVRAVRESRPKYFLFENVKGLLRESFSKYFAYILLQMSYPIILRTKKETWEEHLTKLERHHTASKSSDLSYNVVFRLLNAADFGVPQNRYRVFMVGFRSDLSEEWSFPEKTHTQDKLLWSKWVTGEYWDIHKIACKHRPTIPNKHKKRVERLRGDYQQEEPAGKRYQTVRDALMGLPDPTKPKRNNGYINHDFRKGARAYPGHTGSSLDEPSKTLKAGDHGVPGGENMICYPDGSLRYYTVRESARLQTFPDDYFITGTWSECMRQIGNAVPVHLAELVGKSIIE